VEDRKLSIYEGNYSTHLEKKQQQDLDSMRHYERQQKEISRQEEIIRRFKGHGTEKLVKRAQSREKRLDQLERLDRPEPKKGHVKIHFKESFKSGNDVFRCRDLSMSFEHQGKRRHLFQGVDFEVKRGERICLVGPNGIGKTTLLKVIMGELIPDSGVVEIGHNVTFGYYDQEQQLLVGERTVIEEMEESYRLYTKTELRSFLGRFLFHDDDVFKRIDDLSGGERARLSLLKLMLRGANVLVMDEPTNHLDIRSKEVFEDALFDFPGTLFLVSHDRYLLNKIPTRILELSTKGMENYLGSYDYYMEKKQSITSVKSYLGALGKLSDTPDKNSLGENQSITQKEKRMDDRRKTKELDALKRRRERELASCEQEIEKWEAKILDLEAEISREEVFSDYDALASYSLRLANAKATLEEYYGLWLSIQEIEK
jgi:ATP-binding cassette subfamily F protein 3